MYSFSLRNFNYMNLQKLKEFDGEPVVLLFTHNGEPERRVSTSAYDLYMDLCKNLDNDNFFFVIHKQVYPLFIESLFREHFRLMGSSVKEELYKGRKAQCVTE